MNKQELIAKIAKDTGATKVGAAAALESVLDGITKSLKKKEPITFVGFGTFKSVGAEGSHCAQPADRRRSQDPEAARRPLLGRQGPEDGDQVGPSVRRPAAAARRAPPASVSRPVGRPSPRRRPAGQMRVDARSRPLVYCLLL